VVLGLGGMVIAGILPIPRGERHRAATVEFYTRNPNLVRLGLMVTSAG